MLSSATLVAVVLCGCSAPVDTSRVVVLSDVTIIDGTGAPAQPHMTVVITDNRITAIHPADGRTTPAGAEVLDVAGKFVIPGLIDAHVHLASFDRGNEMIDALLRFALLGGVTSVRDMGGNAPQVIAFAAPGQRTDVPRVYASAVFAGPEWFANYDQERIRFWSGEHAIGAAPWVRRIDAQTDLAAAIRDAAATGVRGIKLYSDIPPARIAELTRLAHAAGLQVWAHAMVPPSRPEELVAAGVNTLSHADQLIWTAAPAGNDLATDRDLRGRLMTSVPAEAAPITALLETMRDRGVLFEPTLLVMQMSRFAEGDMGPPDQVPAWSVAVTRRADELGVSIVAGTDAIGRRTPYIHAELQLLVRQAGLTPLEAIRTATLNGARALGLADSVGTVSVGKWADLVVLGADPSTDIRNTQTVQLVIRGGVVHRRSGAWELGPGAEAAP